MSYLCNVETNKVITNNYQKRSNQLRTYMDTRTVEERGYQQVARLRLHHSE